MNEKNIELINDLTKRCQVIYQDLDKLKDYDNGGAARSTVIQLVDDINEIHKKALRGDNAIKE